VTLECVEKLIKKDMLDPVSGEQLSDRDIIPMQRVRREPIGILLHVLNNTRCLVLVVWRRGQRRRVH